MQASETAPVLAHTPEQRAALMKASLVAGVYENAVDRESAVEKLKGRAGQPAVAGGPALPTQGQGHPWYSNLPSLDSPGLGGGTGGRRGDSLGAAMAKSATRTIGSTVGREIVRGVLGSLLWGSSRRR